MRKFSLLFLSLILALLWSGCTIEKRHYQKGYHVEWNSRKESVKTLEKPEINSLENDRSSEVLNTSSDSSQTRVTDVSEQEIAGQLDKQEKNIRHQKTVKHRSSTLRITRPREIFSGKIDHELPPNRPTGNEADEMAQKSQNYGIATWLSFLFTIILNAAEAVAILSAIAAIGSLIFAILAIVYGNWAKKQMILEPGEYVNRKKAVTGLVLGWVYIILLIVSIVLTVILFLFLIAALG